MRLFITFRDTTHDSRTRGDRVAWAGKYEDILNGRESQYRVRIESKGYETQKIRIDGLAEEAVQKITVVLVKLKEAEQQSHKGKQEIQPGKLRISSQGNE